MGIREWMIVIGILLLLAVLLDGLRRMRRERRDQLNVAARMSGDAKHEDGDSPLTRVESPKPASAAVAGSRIEPSVNEADAAGFFEHNEAPGEPGRQASDDRAEAQEVVTPQAEAAATERASSGTAEPAKELPVEEIIVVNVRAKNELGFNGAELLQILLSCDMRFGKHKIFHRHEHKNGTGAIQFSMANAVEPGVFDLNNIEEFHTAAVAFFLSLPGPEDPIKAFDYMVETAKCVANYMNGELRDADKCLMTAQTLEHHRQRVQEFERRQLAHSH